MGNLSVAAYLQEHRLDMERVIVNSSDVEELQFIRQMCHYDAKRCLSYIKGINIRLKEFEKTTEALTESENWGVDTTYSTREVEPELTKEELKDALTKMGVEFSPKNREKTLRRLYAEAVFDNPEMQEVAQSLPPYEGNASQEFIDAGDSAPSKKEVIERLKNFAGRDTTPSGKKNGKGNEMSEGMAVAYDMLAKLGVGKVKELDESGLRKLMGMIEKAETGE